MKRSRPRATRGAFSLAVDPREVLGARVGGWRLSRVVRRRGAGGEGRYGHGVLAVDARGREGYAKVFDFREVARVSDDAAHAERTLAWAWRTERELLERCRGATRVVRLLAAGRAGGRAGAAVLVFERGVGSAGEPGMVDGRGRAAAALLADVARGLRELHARGIVHQDVKAANVIGFDGSGGRVWKVADLGRASSRDCWGPFAHHWVVGDAAHAPPELLAGRGSGSWRRRGVLTDAYLLGALAYELVMGRALTARIRTRLGPGELGIGDWRREVAWAAAEVARRAGRRSGVLLARVVRRWCEPDPARRAGRRAAEWREVEAALRGAAGD